MKKRSAVVLGFLLLILALVAVSVGGCGESACAEMMSRACDDCQASFSPEWEAACVCWDSGAYVKVNGFHCKDATNFDQNVCRITLDLWNENSCELLNRTLPFRERLPDLGN